VLNGIFAAHLVGVPLFFACKKPQTHPRSEGGSWLACDSYLSVSPSLADTPLSQASQLPQF
jgi:hypothetical protein